MQPAVMTNLATNATTARCSDTGRLRQTCVSQGRTGIKSSITNAVTVVLRLKTDRTNVLRCKGYIFRRFVVRINLTLYITQTYQIQITRTGHTTTTLHLFNSLFSCTTWVSQYQKGKTSLDLNEARDDGVLGCSVPYANNLHLAPDK